MELLQEDEGPGPGGKRTARLGTAGKRCSGKPTGSCLLLAAAGGLVSSSLAISIEFIGCVIPLSQASLRKEVAFQQIYHVMLAPGQSRRK